MVFGTTRMRWWSHLHSHLIVWSLSCCSHQKGVASGACLPYSNLVSSAQPSNKAPLLNTLTKNISQIPTRVSRPKPYRTFAMAKNSKKTRAGHATRRARIRRLAAFAAVRLLAKTSKPLGEHLQREPAPDKATIDKVGDASQANCPGHEELSLDVQFLAARLYDVEQTQSHFDIELKIRELDDAKRNGVQVVQKWRKLENDIIRLQARYLKCHSRGMGNFWAMRQMQRQVHSLTQKVQRVAQRGDQTMEEVQRVADEGKRVARAAREIADQVNTVNEELHEIANKVQTPAKDGDKLAFALSEGSQQGQSRTSRGRTAPKPKGKAQAKERRRRTK
ncbi:hypothetical protein B0T25DRAFT_289759 [Lasiosphaeria hispida]|uniref:Uncharacterized protein n=1 Tax=Lasiosphaeria hispida TaxID=260671 RepID=A0AAJ0HC41_9PEZI|nr:hypothetical protein B0T25DRAFT_289759 [Lasiosphaeria hispida]